MGSAATLTVPGLFSSCRKKNPHLTPLRPSHSDQLLLTDGFNYKLLLEWGDVINEKGDTFGFNNDYTAIIPSSSKECFMWVNHEYPNPLFIHGKTEKKSKSHVDLERYSCGGSILKIQQNDSGHWQLKKNSKYNRRITGATPIPLSRPVAGSSTAIGTMANCAGGVSPWGTILSCEENYQDYYGEVDIHGKKIQQSRFGWDEFYDCSPLHYGWVVEIHLQSGRSRKLTSLGRFAHEGATPYQLKDGRVVVYSGDDRADGFIYKFISTRPNSYEEGELFVADTKKGKWLSLNRDKNPLLKKTFKNQLDVLTHCRLAGEIAGGTPQDRPEDIEINPHTKEVLVCLTNNIKKGNFFGKILKIRERDHSGTEFDVEDFSVGGRDGFACPDNMAFDNKGNLWMTTDMSGSLMNKPPYDKFKNNGLFYFPLSGMNAGRACQIASAPVDAELTGPSFSPDYQTLFLSVQHPGEKTKDIKNPTGHWPSGKGIPKPAVVQIYGEGLSRLTRG